MYCVKAHTCPFFNKYLVGILRNCINYSSQEAFSSLTAVHNENCQRIEYVKFLQLVGISYITIRSRLTTLEGEGHRGLYYNLLVAMPFNINTEVSSKSPYRHSTPCIHVQFFFPPVW